MARKVLDNIRYKEETFKNQETGKLNTQFFNRIDLQVILPDYICAAIWGVRGEKVAEIEQESSAKLVTSRCLPDSTDRVMQYQGDTHSLHLCIKAIGRRIIAAIPSLPHVTEIPYVPRRFIDHKGNQEFILYGRMEYTGMLSLRWIQQIIPDCLIKTIDASSVAESDRVVIKILGNEINVSKAKYLIVTRVMLTCDNVCQNLIQNLGAIFGEFNGQSLQQAFQNQNQPLDGPSNLAAGGATGPTGLAGNPNNSAINALMSNVNVQNTNQMPAINSQNSVPNNSRVINRMILPGETHPTPITQKLAMEDHKNSTSKKSSKNHTPQMSPESTFAGPNEASNHSIISQGTAGSAHTTHSHSISHRSTPISNLGTIINLLNEDIDTEYDWSASDHNQVVIVGTTETNLNLPSCFEHSKDLERPIRNNFGPIKKINIKKDAHLRYATLTFKFNKSVSDIITKPQPYALKLEKDGNEYVEIQAFRSRPGDEEQMRDERTLVIGEVFYF